MTYFKNHTKSLICYATWFFFFIWFFIYNFGWKFYNMQWKGIFFFFLSHYHSMSVFYFNFSFFIRKTTKELCHKLKRVNFSISYYIIYIYLFITLIIFIFIIMFQTLHNIMIFFSLFSHTLTVPNFILAFKKHVIHFRKGSLSSVP